MIVVYMHAKSIFHFDSLNLKGDKQMKHILQWIKDDIADKSKVVDIDGDDDYELWNLQNISTTPQQNNTCDCGVFTILCADYISDDLKLLYRQEDIPMWRKKIGIAILNHSLPY